MTSLMGRIDWGCVAGTLLVLVTAVVFYGAVVYCIIWGVHEICEVLL